MPPLVGPKQEPSPSGESVRLVAVQVTAVAPDEEGGGLYLAVERGLREVHRGDTVRLQGTGATTEVTSVEPTAELPVFVGFPSAAFNPKAGDVLELRPKPGDDLPALIS
ncbi:hypothetical protein ACIHQR_10495 [Corallococcus coralloides]|uniref:hypothetical protein n=1 Tax=Corallococcus coralloides TaxID=184914 RepID=UPI00384E6757